MLNRMLRDRLNAELSTVRSLRQEARLYGDAFTEQQFASRERELTEELARTPLHEGPEAALTVLFGGRPVLGSSGVLADLAGKSLDSLQEMVSKRFAEAEFGDLGARGPVPGQRGSRLMVTEVARGSFGFVLKEAPTGDQQQLIRTQLAEAVTQTADLIAKLGAAEADLFEQAMAELDGRQLAAARKFFRTLDEASATLRIVEERHDFSLDRAAVERARLRTEQTEIEEDPGVELQGRLLGHFPVQRRFEFERFPAGDVIRGSVQEDANRDIQQRGERGVAEDPIHKAWIARFHVRSVRRRNAEPRHYYTLLGLVRRIL